jgi:tetratricopeptide (TPR) repeat protein
LHILNSLKISMTKFLPLLTCLSLAWVSPLANQFTLAPALAQDGAVQQKIQSLKQSAASGGAETAFMSAGSATMYGIEWLENKKYLEASWRFQEAIKTDPEYAIAHFLLGRAYAGLGQKELARASFAEAARLNPEFAAEAEVEIARLTPPPTPRPQPAVAKPAAPRQNAAVRTPLAAPKTPAQKPPKLIALKRKPGYAIGRCVTMSGKPLANVRIRVFGVANNGNDVNFTTRTNTAGAYAVKLTPGVYHVGWALWDVPAPGGPPYSLPLHPLDGSIADAPSAAGIAEDFVLKIAGHISPRKDAQSELSYYGGSVRVFGGAIADPPQFGDSSYRFPAGSKVQLTLKPLGALLDRSAGQTLTRSKAVNSSATFFDIPIGRYQVMASLIQANGAQTPLRVAVARFGVGTNPTRFTPSPNEFAASGTLYFPSSGDSTPLLTMPGVGTADVYVQP